MQNAHESTSFRTNGLRLGRSVRPLLAALFLSTAAAACATPVTDAGSVGAGHVATFSSQPPESSEGGRGEDRDRGSQGRTWNEVGRGEVARAGQGPRSFAPRGL